MILSQRHGWSCVPFGLWPTPAARGPRAGAKITDDAEGLLCVLGQIDDIAAICCALDYWCCTGRIMSQPMSCCRLLDLEW